MWAILETPEDDLLRVETCSVTKLIKIVALTVKLVLSVVLTQQDANNINKKNILPVYLIRGHIPRQALLQI